MDKILGWIIIDIYLAFTLTGLYIICKGLIEMRIEFKREMKNINDKGEK